MSIRGAQLASVGQAVGRVLRVWVRLLCGLPAYAVAALLLTVAGVFTGSRLVLAGVVAWLLPSVVAAGWAALWPSAFDRCAAGPYRRWVWRRWARRVWGVLARDCGLAVWLPAGSGVGVWRGPDLVDVATCGDVLSLVVRVRSGQTPADVEAAVPAVAAAAEAVSHRVRLLSPSIVRVDLVMRDTLTEPTYAVMPTQVGSVDEVVVGWCQDGSPWRLTLRGRHTLVVGCSGAGKGSILWGIAAGLAPAVHVDLVRLWGVDLKRGVELGIGQGLFHTIATTPGDAIRVLTDLLGVIDARAATMVGRTRLHEPTAGDPVHVLVVDELAALVGYADPETRRDATRLLSEVLTQGRALGVVVVALVQDPRKDTVSMRGLFTQTVALRLRSVEETRMVLGDGMATLAPAHRISPSTPGTGYVVADDGSVDRVRAHWWSDQLVRDTAASYPAPVAATPDATTADEGTSTEPAAESLVEGPAVALPARPRKPRTPRTTRRATASSGVLMRDDVDVTA